MTDKTKTALPDPYEPWDQDAYARDLEKSTMFGRMVDEWRPTDLKRGLENLANTGDPEIISLLEAAGGSDPRIPKKFFLSDGQEATIFADAEGWHAVLQTEGEYLTFTSPDRDTCMASASRYVEKTREPRELTESELLRVAYLVQSGQTPSALELYIQLSLGKQVTDKSASEVLENPKYRPILNQAAYVVWKYSRQDFTPSDEFVEVLNEVAATKPLTNAVIDALYDKFCDDRAHLVRSTAPATPKAERQPAPTPEEVQAELDTMSDERIGNLRVQVLQHRGRAIRRFDERMRGSQ